VTNFKGKNNFNLTRFIYNQRLNYKANALKDIKTKDNIKDFNFIELTQYGRIDSKMYSIEPKTKHITKVGTVGSEASALKFVCEAFSKVEKHFRFATTNGLISLNETYLTNLVAYRGWTDPHFMYQKHMTKMIDAYNTVYLPTSGYEIDSVTDYANLFVNFQERMSDKYPITYSAWQRSKMSSPFTSGLYIDVAGLDISNDSLKEEFFLNSPNFNFYLSTVRNNGFYVSKNAPFILCADINSAPMKVHMSNDSYSYADLLNVNEPFNVDNHYFTRCYTHDLGYLKEYIFQGYKKYIKTFFVKEEKNYCSNNKLSVKLIFKENIDYDQYNNLIDFNLLIKLYINIRNIEENHVFGKADVARIVKNAKDQTKYFDKANIIGYVNEQFRSTYKDKPGGFNDMRKYYAERKRRKDDISDT